MKNKILEFLKNKRNLIVLIVVLVLLIAGAAIGIVACNKKTDLTDDTNVASVDTEKVEPTEVVETETAETETADTETEVVENTETEVASNETSAEKNNSSNKNNTSNSNSSSNSNSNTSTNTSGTCQHEYGSMHFSWDVVQEAEFEDETIVVEPEKTTWYDDGGGEYDSYEAVAAFYDAYSWDKSTITSKTTPAVIQELHHVIKPCITQQHWVWYCGKCGQIYKEEWGEQKSSGTSEMPYIY